MIVLRPYQPDDAQALLALFRDTIRRVNVRDYAPDQIAAWSSDAIDPNAWAARFSGRHVVVAELADCAVGFAELEFNGHIDRFYVSADLQCRGIGGAMLSALETEARRLGLVRLDLESSITARPFFEGRGFRLVTPQMVSCRGVEFLNYRMEKHLTPSAAR